MNRATITSLRNQLDALFLAHQNLMGDFVRATDQEEREEGLLSEIDDHLVSIDNSFMDLEDLLSDLVDDDD